MRLVAHNQAVPVAPLHGLAYTEYFSTGNAGDTMHTADGANVQVGDRVRWIAVDGTGVEVNTLGSTRADSAAWTIQFHYRNAGRWYGPFTVTWS